LYNNRNDESLLFGGDGLIWHRLLRSTACAKAGASVLLPSPEHMPVVLKHKDLGWVRDADEFADWLMVHWRPETLVIAVL